MLAIIHTNLSYLQRYEDICVSNKVNLQIYLSLIYLKDLFYINSGMPAFEF